MNKEEVWNYIGISYHIGYTENYAKLYKKASAKVLEMVQEAIK